MRLLLVCFEEVLCSGGGHELEVSLVCVDGGTAAFNALNVISCWLI